MAVQSAGEGERAAALINEAEPLLSINVQSLQFCHSNVEAGHRTNPAASALGSQAEELLQDSEEDKEDRDGLTCAVCLDIFICPHVCRPCGHSFCEPCLRTIANNRPMNTPCPLCRTLISHTTFNKGE